MPALSSDRSLLLIGEPNIRNLVLFAELSTHTGCDCDLCAYDVALSRPRAQASTLVLFDAQAQPPEALGYRLHRVIEHYPRSFLALLNCGRELQLDDFITWPMLRGGLPPGAPVAEVVKAVNKIHDGEYWISRQVVSQVIHDVGTRMRADVGYLDQLTVRERSVLELICDGSSNKHIAETLYISVHTVKSHTYNLFRKLHVGNRVQAASIAHMTSIANGMKRNA